MSHFSYDSQNKSEMVNLSYIESVRVRIDDSSQGRGRLSLKNHTFHSVSQIEDMEYNT